jgi:hypothetical protein
VEPPKRGLRREPEAVAQGAGIGPPPPVRLPTPRPEGGSPSPFWPQPLQLPPAACYSGRYGARATESNSSNPASQGSLTAEPIGVTRREEEDCEDSPTVELRSGGGPPSLTTGPAAPRVDTWCSTSHPVCVRSCAPETPPPAHSMSQEASPAAPRLFPGHLLRTIAGGSNRAMSGVLPLGVEGDPIATV